MKRLFTAIHISPSEKLLHLYEDMRKDLHFARITWVKPENLHLTLKFFGDTPEDKIPDIDRVLTLAVSLHKPFDIMLHDVGIFGSRHQPRVIWIGISQVKEMISLGNHVLEGVEQIGWERDRQNFVPHLTVGRVKDAVDRQLFQKVIDEYKGKEIQTAQVDRLHLYESILKREGPEYYVVSTYTLGDTDVIRQ